MKNNEYKEKINEMVKTDREFHPDTLELIDDALTIVLGPRIEDSNEEYVPPCELECPWYDPSHCYAWFTCFT